MSKIIEVEFCGDKYKAEVDFTTQRGKYHISTDRGVWEREEENVVDMVILDLKSEETGADHNPRLVKPELIDKIYEALCEEEI